MDDSPAGDPDVRRNIVLAAIVIAAAMLTVGLPATRRNLIDMITHDMAMLDANLDLAHAIWTG